jgi:hypothetical protein
MADDETTALNMEDGRGYRAFALGIAVLGLIAVIVGIGLTIGQDAPSRATGQPATADGTSAVIIDKVRRDGAVWTLHVVQAKSGGAQTPDLAKVDLVNDEAFTQALRSIIVVASAPSVAISVGDGVKISTCARGVMPCSRNVTTIEALSKSTAADTTATARKPIYWISVSDGEVDRIVGPWKQAAHQ